jgi:hypothetical protein
MAAARPSWTVLDGLWLKRHGALLLHRVSPVVALTVALTVKLASGIALLTRLCALFGDPHGCDALNL